MAVPKEAPSAGRGDTLLRAGVALSLVASLCSLALSVAAYRRSAEASSIPPPSRAVESAPAAPGPPRADLPPPRPIPRGAELPPARPPGDTPPPGLNRRDPGASSSASPAVAALASKLNLSPEALAPLLEGGSLPASTAARLEQSAAAGQELGRRLGITDPRAEALPNVLVAYTLRVMLAEREARPGSVDPARVQELRAETLATFRALGGEGAAREAASTLDRLDAAR